MTIEAEPPAYEPLTSRFSDAWNPVLVKDVRQALHGRLFTYGFIIALTLAVLATTSWATRAVDPDGRVLYGWLLACLSLFNLLFIPLATFRSLASEADEGRLEHLLLTRMGAVRIVTGKLGAALVQVGLCMLAFAPFMLMCGLARGIDSAMILQGLAGQLSTATLMASAALAAALMARGAFGRLAWQVALVGFIWFVSGISVFVRHPGLAWQIVTLRALLGNFCLALGFVVFFVAVAAVRVQSDAENRSSTLRIGTSIAMGIEAVGLLLTPGSSFYMQTYQGILALLFLALPAVAFVTESPALTRGERNWIRTHPRVPAMYAPGRDTAVLFLWSHQLLIVGAAFATHLRTPAGRLMDDGAGALLALPVMICIYLILPSSLLGSMSRTRRGRTRLRFLIAGLVPAAIFLPPLIFFFLGRHSNGLGHALNPYYVLNEVFARGQAGTAAALLGALAVPMSCLVLWRTGKGVQQVRAIRRA